MVFERAPTVRRLLMLLLAVTMVAGAISGCGQPEAKPPAPKPQEKPAERILRFTAANLPKLDPAVGSDEASATAHVNFYDSLVFPNPDATISPWVATKWEVSKDGLQWTFFLRNDVKFHNGNVLTAEDVVFSLERLLKIGQGWAYLFKGRVDKAEAIDKTTVRFTLTKPFGPFLSILPRLYIVNKAEVMARLQKPGLYGDMGDYGTQWLLTKDAGSGPYMVKEMKQGEYLLADMYKGYWQKFKPGNPTSFKLMGTTEAITVRTLMSRRELEISDAFQSIENLAALAKISGVTVALTPSTGHTDLMLNNKKPPTDDVNFRKALAYCVDYGAISKDILPDAPAPIGMVPSRIAGHNPNVEQPKFDLQEAEKWLKKSKYYKDLAKYPVELAWVAEVPDREKIALLVQANALKIGIKVNVVRVPWVSLVDRAPKPETTPNATIVSMSPDYPEAGGYMFPRWHSSGKGTWLQMDWLLDKDIDKMLEDALQIAEWDSRMQKYKAIQSKLMEIQPSVVLTQGLGRRAYQSNYVVWPHADNAKAGKPIHTVMGYSFYMPTIEVFPERIPK